MSKTLQILDLANSVGGRIIGNMTNRGDITGTSALDNYIPNRVSFLKNKKYAPLLASLKNAIVLIPEDSIYLGDTYPQNTYIVVQNVAHAILYLQQFFYGEDLKISETGISPGARIGSNVKLGKAVFIDNNVCIGNNVEIGDRSKILANAVVGDNVTIGQDTLIEYGAIIRRDCHLGDNVIIHSGVCIGSDLFRYEQYQQPPAVHKMLQVGSVDIGDRVEIGWNTVICKATFEGCATVLSDDVKIADLVCIGHNVRIGARTLVAAEVCISGSTQVGEDVWIGVGAAITNGIRIGNRAKILLNAVVAYDVPEGEMVSGFYAMPHKKWKRAFQMLKEATNDENPDPQRLLIRSETS